MPFRKVVYRFHQSSSNEKENDLDETPNGPDENSIDTEPEPKAPSPCPKSPETYVFVSSDSVKVKTEPCPSTVEPLEPPNTNELLLSQMSALVKEFKGFKSEVFGRINRLGVQLGNIEGRLETIELNIGVAASARINCFPLQTIDDYRTVNQMLEGGLSSLIVKRQFDVILDATNLEKTYRKMIARELSYRLFSGKHYRGKQQMDKDNIILIYDNDLIFVKMVKEALNLIGVVLEDKEIFQCFVKYLSKQHKSDRNMKDKAKRDGKRKLEDF